MGKGSEAVYEGIRREILSTSVSPGDRLIEVKLGERLGCGRTPVREALRRLHGEGMVERRRTGGYVVRTLVAADMLELRELREVLEVSGVELTARREGRGVIRELRRICDVFDSQVERGYVAGACEADLDFHRTLMEGTGNQRLMDLYRVANIPLFHHQLSGGRMNDYRQTSAEHRAIVERVAAGDVVGAAELMRQHIGRGAKEVQAGGANVSFMEK